MGLDMYLEMTNKVTGEMTTIYSWRKANQIRAWLVNRFKQDPDAQLKAKLTPEIIESLIFDITQVLANHKLASHLLPSSAGFFFGSIAYDEDYFKTLVYTLDYLTHHLTWHEEVEDLYYTEWW